MMFSRHLRLIIALYALGSTADDVAESLDKGGWRGLPGNAGTCPVARYLIEVVPDVSGASVSNSSAIVFTSDGQATETVMPIGPAAFIGRFDDGAYSYLVDHSEPSRYARGAAIRPRKPPAAPRPHRSAIRPHGGP